MVSNILRDMKKDHRAMLRLVEESERAVRMHKRRGHLEQLVHRISVLDDAVIRPHIDRCASVLYPAVDQVLQGDRSRILETAKRNQVDVREAIAMMIRGIETGKDLLPVLDNVARSLREFVEFEQEVLLPWIADTVPDAEIQRIDARSHAGAGRPRRPSHHPSQPISRNTGGTRDGGRRDD